MESSQSSSSSQGSEVSNTQNKPKIPKRLTKGKGKPKGKSQPQKPPKETPKQKEKEKDSEVDSSDNESESDRLDGPGHFGHYSNKDNPKIFEIYAPDEKYKISDVSMSQHVKLYDQKITKRILELEEKNEVNKQVLSESLIHRLLVTAEHETKNMINKLTDPNQHNPWAVPADMTDSRGKHRVTVIKLRWADLYNLVWGNNHSIKEIATNQVRNMRMTSIMHNLTAERIRAFYQDSKNRMNKIEKSVKIISDDVKKLSGDVAEIKSLVKLLVSNQNNGETLSENDEIFEKSIKIETPGDTPEQEPQDFPNPDDDESVTPTFNNVEYVPSPFLHVDGGDDISADDDDDEIKIIAFLDLNEDQEFAKLEKQRRDRLVKQLLTNAQLKEPTPEYSLDEKKKLLKTLRHSQAPTNICAPVEPKKFKKQFNMDWKPYMTTLATFDPDKVRRDDFKTDLHTIPEEHNSAAKRPSTSGSKCKKKTSGKKTPTSGKKVKRKFIESDSDKEEDAGSKDVIFDTDDEDFEPPKKKRKSLTKS